MGGTGAGKSSIIQALFRLANLDGIIRIDGIDTSTVGLHDLRKQISIIPQDPVLFSETLRFNLDPFNDSTDDQLWKALAEVSTYLRFALYEQRIKINKKKSSN